jgi:hypothetical protein
MPRAATTITIRNIRVAFLTAIASFPPFINPRKHFSIKDRSYLKSASGGCEMVSKLPVTSPNAGQLTGIKKKLNIWKKLEINMDCMAINQLKSEA